MEKSGPMREFAAPGIECEKKLEVGNEFRSVMDDTIRTFTVQHAEDGRYRHTDMDLVRLTDEVGGDPGSFFQFYDRQHIWFQSRELLTCGREDRVCQDLSFTGTLAWNNFSIPATVRTNCSWREKHIAAGLAFRSHQIISLRDLSPISCYCHLRPSRRCVIRP